MADEIRRPVDRPPLTPAATFARLAVIGAVVLGLTGAFAYVGGWLTPARLTQDRMVGAFETINGTHVGFRRNHSKGLCATGWFDSNGAVASLSQATLFKPGRVPVVGRFAFAGGMPFVPDDPSTVRSLALRFMPSGAEEWRTGMINIPVFIVSKPQAFYDQMFATQPDPATGKPNPQKVQAFAAAHPEFVAAVTLIKARKVSPGFSDTTYNALHTFDLISDSGTVTPVRWSVTPAQPPPAEAQTAPSPAGDKNALFDVLIADGARHPLQWHLVFTVGQSNDTINPTLPWPSDRKQVDAGVITLDHLSSEDGGPCTDVNYDPLVLPAGIQASADPILSARSASYARSFTLREGERQEKPPSAVTPAEVANGGKS